MKAQCTGVTKRGALFAASAALVALLSAAQAHATTIEAFKTPGHYSFVVPVGVDSLTVAALGGAGGGCLGTEGGEGARAAGTFPVSPGQRLIVTVAGSGSICAEKEPSPGAGGAGGIGGGAAGGGGTYLPGSGGGGASSVAPGTSTPELQRALIVAAGGGGAAPFGANGGNAGAAGTAGKSSPATGGGAATLSVGGKGGASGGEGATAGGTGTLGEGGAGGNSAGPGGALGAGGGGAGLYGGGGGGGSYVSGYSGGGGGGSSFIAADGSNLTAAAPTKEAPEVTLSYIVSPPPTLEHASLSRHRLHAGQHAAFKFTLSENAKLSIAVTTTARGLRKGTHCVAPSKALEHRHAKKCKRAIVHGTLAASEPAGNDTLNFNGKIRGRKLAPGEYTATLSATNYAGETRPFSIHFVVLK